tara:strand:- start:10519 stop:11958 length:1440 start_codon:yes stop_codon:yes gene_type:complete
MAIPTRYTHPMVQFRIPIFLAFFSLTSGLRAQDGAQLYSLYCSACHGADGKGATGGAFPPLAGSDWIAGHPKRSLAIVLFGLEGPIEVNGKAYNLVMPPQGAVLENSQILAILNYINSSWGNKGEKIKWDLVRTVRSEFKSRDTPWTAKELLKLFPLEKKETALKNVISRLYKGQWEQLPDFEKIQAEAVEEEHDGIISLAKAGMKDGYGIVWEGDFMAPSDGKFVFNLDADDGARLFLNDAVVAEVKGTGPMGNKKRASKGKTQLKKGKNVFRLEYFQSKGTEGISLNWKLNGKGKTNWLTEPAAGPKTEFPLIPVSPTAEKTVIYRNFIDGTTPRAIGFGFPGGVNLAYSADHLAPELVWPGDFIDAGRHWTNRGQGNQPPSSEKVIKLTKQRYLPTEARFKGYRLDANGNPTFAILIGKQVLSDSWKPGETGTLVRTLTLNSGAALQIPLGNAAVTGSEKTSVSPDKPTTIIYNLK